jgi:fermentation-respiration switch protein FrsA (DUF1100 family)
LNQTRWHLNSDYSDRLLADRNEVLLPDRQSAELGAAARRDNPAAVTQLPLEFVDDTLGFNPEWIVDRIAPRPVLFITADDDRLVPPQESEAMFARAGEPKKLVILKGFGHYEVYGGEAFRQVMDETAAERQAEQQFSIVSAKARAKPMASALASDLSWSSVFGPLD